MAISATWLEFLREQYPQGSTVKIKELKEKPPRTAHVPIATLDHIDSAGVFHVRLDDGSSLGLILGEDRFSVLPPEPTTLKLYMPLTADLYERNRYGDLEDDSTELDDRDLVDFVGPIMVELLKSRRPEETERGLMHWYHEEDSINRKVCSAALSTEIRGGRLLGVAECRVVGALTPEELETLKEYIVGQAADGQGEDFEQRSIPAADGDEVNVHFWNSGSGWSIQTEQELFGPTPIKRPQTGEMRLG